MSVAKRKARVLKNGRNSGSASFIKLDHFVFDCSAYRSMKPGPRALLDELIRRYNGSNNGHIGLGQREAATRLNVNKDTVPGYFDALVERGFIAVARPGGFNMKDPTARRATEWRLTWHKTDCIGATKDFLRWVEEDSAARNIGITCPDNRDTGAGDRAHCPENPDEPGERVAISGPDNSGTYTSGHRRDRFGRSIAGRGCDATWAAITDMIEQAELG